MVLSKENKAYLKFLGYEERDMKQIEDACNESVFAIFRRDSRSIRNIPEQKKIRIVTAEEMKQLLGEEKFIKFISRSAFHYSTSGQIPRTMEEFGFIIDSGEMLRGKPSKLLNWFAPLEITVEEIIIMQNTPHIYAAEIDWDIDWDEVYDYLDNMTIAEAAEVLAIPVAHYDRMTTSERHDYAFDKFHHCPGELDELLGLPDKVEIPAEIWENSDEYYADDISEYISDKCGYCHQGFVIDCNLNLEELYALKESESVDKELIERAITLLEAEREFTQDEPLIEE